MLVWLDLEMTGLDPDNDLIVEIATLVTDDDLKIVAEGPDIVISAPAERLEAMSDVVRGMHERSGLLEAIKASTVTLEEAGKATLDFVRTHIPHKASAPLCGNSIGVDRRFLAKHLPDLETYLHYRSVDVSSVKELCRRWNPKLATLAPRKSNTHRALDDIRESVAELAYYRDTFFRLPEPRPATAAEPLSAAAAAPERAK
jgi:oligoribonuclease